MVVRALARFCVRDTQFPGYFALFVLATNFVFYKGDGGDDIRNVLACARDNPALDGFTRRNTVRKFIVDLAKMTTLSVDSVIGTLAKVNIDERMTGIDQPDLELIPALGQLEACAELHYGRLMVVARLLKARVWEASSLALDSAVIAQHEIVRDFGGHIARLQAVRKRIDARELLELFVAASSGDSINELLTISSYLARDSIPPGLGRMEFKMAAGAITYSEIAQMKDDVASLESAFVRWKERYGLEVANRRLAHFQYLAFRDVRAAEATVSSPEAPYGQALLESFRRRASATAMREQASLFGCRAEHVVGAGGLLTEECKVWWSEPVTIEHDDGHPA